MATEEFGLTIVLVLMVIALIACFVGQQEQETTSAPTRVSIEETPEWLKTYDQPKEVDTQGDHRSHIGIRIPICDGNPNENQTGAGSLSTAGYGINLGGGLVYVP